MVRRIAQDTMPPESLRAIRMLWRSGKAEATIPLACEDIRKAANIDGAFYRQLRQWAIIGITVRHGEDSYSLHPDFAGDVESTGFMEGLD